MNNLIKVFALALAALVGSTGAIMSAAPVQAAITECGSFSRYANQIISESGIMSAGELPDDSASVLGAPDGGSADFTGHVTVGFAHNVRIVNGDGNDFLVHLEDFSTVGSNGTTVGSNGTTPENEPFTVLASADGVSDFVSLGTKSPSGPAVGVRQAFGFDLAAAGLAKAQQIKIVSHNSSLYGGPEIDAIEIVNGTNCPDATPTPSPTPTPISKKGSLDVEKTDGKTSARPGDTLTYTITVKNTGEVDIEDLKVTDNLPDEVQVVDVTPHTSWNINSDTIVWENRHLGAGATEKFTIQVRVNDNTANGTRLVNEVTVKSENRDAADSAKDDDTQIKRPGAIAAAVVVKKPIAPVQVTAKTGAGEIAALLTVVGATGLAITRKFLA